MAGFYDATSLLKGTNVPQFNVANILNAGNQVGSAFNSFLANEINTQNLAFKRQQLEQQKELAMLPYDMKQKEADKANSLINMSQAEVANSNPNADRVFNDLYSNVNNEQDLAKANEKLFTSLGGQKDSTGFVQLDPTKLNQFNKLVEGTDQEKAIRTRDAIIRNALAQGVDPTTANALATNEYNRLYGTQAATNQELVKEELKSLDDRLKYALEYGVGKPKGDGTNINIGIGGGTGTGGLGSSVNTSTISGTNTRDIGNLTENINSRFGAGNDFTSLGSTPKAVTQLAIKAQSIDPTLTNDQILKALDLISTGQADKILQLDPSISLSADNEADVLKLAQLAKTTGPGTTNFSDSTRGKSGQLDADTQSQLLADRMKVVNEIMNQVDKTRQAYSNQLNPQSSYTQLSNFLQPVVENPVSTSTTSKGSNKRVNLTDSVGEVKTSINNVPDSLQLNEGLSLSSYEDAGGKAVGFGYNYTNKSPNEIRRDFKEAGLSNYLADSAIKNEDINLTRPEAESLAQVAYKYHGTNKASKIVPSFNSFDPMTKEIVADMAYRGDLVNNENSYRGRLAALAQAGDINKIYEYVDTSSEVPQEVKNRMANILTVARKYAVDSQALKKNTTTMPITTSSNKDTVASVPTTITTPVSDESIPIDNKIQELIKTGQNLPSGSQELDAVNQNINALVKERENRLRGQQLAASMNPSGNTSLMSEQSKELTNQAINQAQNVLTTLGYSAGQITNVLKAISQNGINGVLNAPEIFGKDIVNVLKQLFSTPNYVNGTQLIPNQPEGYKDNKWNM